MSRSSLLPQEPPALDELRARLRSLPPGPLWRPLILITQGADSLWSWRDARNSQGDTGSGYATEHDATEAACHYYGLLKSWERRSRKTPWLRKTKMWRRDQAVRQRLSYVRPLIPREAYYRMIRGRSLTSDEFLHIRKRIGINQRDLALTMGVIPRTLRRWETGETAVPISAMMLLTLIDYRGARKRKWDYRGDRPKPRSGFRAPPDVETVLVGKAPVGKKRGRRPKPKPIIGPLTVATPAAPRTVKVRKRKGLDWRAD